GRRCLLGPATSLRHLEGNEVARRHGGHPADNDNAAEELFYLRRGFRVGCALACDDAAKEPAWPVDTDEAGQSHCSGLSRGGRRDLGEQLRAEGAGGELRGAALLADLI